MPCIIIGPTRAIVGYVCVIAGPRENEKAKERETHREKFMRGRNEQPNRTKWTCLASPRINKQQQMTAYVRPFPRHRFHRSGSRSVKNPLLTFSLSLSLRPSSFLEDTHSLSLSSAVILLPSSLSSLDPGPPAVTLPKTPASSMDHLHYDRYRSRAIAPLLLSVHDF